MRDMVRNYFAKALDGYVSRLNDTGWPDQQLDLLKQELDVHKDAIGGFDDLSDLYLDAGTIEGFRASAGFSDDDWAENEPDLRRELRKARRDQIKAFLSRAESLEGYSFTELAQTAPAPPEGRSVTLNAALEDFMQEHSPRWSEEIAEKS